MRTPRWNLSAEMLTALSAVVAALIALGVGVWENVPMRRHNRLSVVPHLDFTAQVQASDTAATLEAFIWLTNEGVGPARVEDLEIYLRMPDGRVRSFRSWGEALPALESLGVSVPTRAETRPGLMLGVGRRLDLIHLVVDRSAGAADIMSLLSRLGIVVQYHSIYGDDFEASFNADAALGEFDTSVPSGPPTTGLQGTRGGAYFRDGFRW